MEHAHQEALRKVIQVLTKGKDIILLPARGVIDAASLHSGAKTTDTGHLVIQILRTFHDA